MPVFNKISNAMVRTPSPKMEDGITSKALGSGIDHSRALAQHKAYVSALKELGAEVIELDPDPENPDSHFIEDTAVIIQGRAIISNPGSPERRREILSASNALKSLMETTHIRGKSSFLEGGDVLVLKDKVLVGVSSRTNEEGVTQLASILNSMDVDLPVIGVHFSGVLHLKTGLTAINNDVLLHDPEFRFDGFYMPITRRNIKVKSYGSPFEALSLNRNIVTDELEHQKSRKIEETSFPRIITVPREEGYGANVLPINKGIVVSMGCPEVKRYAEMNYSSVKLLDIGEFNKMDGGLTCLSLRW